MLDKYLDVLTVKEMCEVLRIGRNSAYKLLQSNTIPNIRIGQKKYIIPKDGLIKYLSSCYL